MADIRVKLKNADGEILLPVSLSDILAHGYGENASFDETTVKAELDKLLSLMTSSGASLDEAITALQELNTKSSSLHYTSLVDLATFIENFMVDSDVAEEIIDTWKELEDFLKGITDTDTLTGLLQESYNRLTAEKSAVAVGDDEKFITVTKTDEDTTYTDEKGDKVDTTYPLYTITTNDIASASELANLESTVAGISSDLSDYAKASDLEEVKETAEAAATAAEAAQSDVDDLKDTVESLGDSKQDKLTAVDPISISDDNKISIDLSAYLTTEDAADTYATQGALNTVSTVANAASAQADTNAIAIEALQATVATGVYYEEITN